MAVQRIADFDTWRPGYGNDSVLILKAGTEETAAVFFDEQLTRPAPNPQTLLQRNDDGISYGKWAQPIYTAQAHFLRIASIDQTGTDRPSLTTLEGEGASQALVTVDGGSETFPLATILARSIDVRDYGDFLATGTQGTSSASNTAAIAAAIGAATAAGVGYVDLPGGNYQFLNASIPPNLVLRGRERTRTVLQSTLAGRIITLAGGACGLSRLTLDGINQTAGSMGVYGVGVRDPILEDVRLRRFEQAGQIKGAVAPMLDGLVVSDNVRGLDLRGDLDAAGGNQGSAIRSVSLDRARFELNSEFALNIESKDAAALLIRGENVIFDTNTGVALRVRGARRIEFDNAQFTGNTKNLDVDDATPADTATTVRGLRFQNTLFSGGDIKLKGTLEDVVFDRSEFVGNRIVIETPKNNVLALDCTEDFAVTLEGTPTAWQRRNTTDSGASSGLTTGDAATKAWAATLQFGQRVFLTAKVIGRGRNNNDTGFYYMAVSAERPPAALNYDSQTGNFTKGNLVRGKTSGALGRIVGDTDNGATGTLLLTDLAGTFIDDEIIIDDATGSATANGSTSAPNAVLVGAVTDLRAPQEVTAAWASTFAANGPQIELRVQGVAGATIEWTAEVEVTST